MVKRIYMYVVSFATLMMMIGGGIGTFSSVADLIAPARYHYVSYQDYVNMYHPKFEDEKIKIEEKSEEELKEEYGDYLKKESERERSMSVNNLIQSIGWIVIPLPFFILSQRQIKRENEKE